MIRPVRSSGRSGRGSHARANMSSGPITQFNSSEKIVRRSASSSPRWPYPHLGQDGRYIMAREPTAIGRETVSTLIASSAP